MAGYQSNVEGLESSDIKIASAASRDARYSTVRAVAVSWGERTEKVPYYVIRRVQKLLTNQTLLMGARSTSRLCCGVKLEPAIMWGFAHVLGVGGACSSITPQSLGRAMWGRDMSGGRQFRAGPYLHLLCLYSSFCLPWSHFKTGSRSSCRH